MASFIRLLRPGFLVGAIGLSTVASVPPAIGHAFAPPPEHEAPGATAGGGSRPSRPTCSQPGFATMATALAPQTFVGLSRDAQPTLWLHLPNSNIKTLELSLFDEQLQGIIQAQISLTGDTSLVPLSLPQAFALDPGRAYYWTAALICNPKRRTEDWVMGGWIRYQPLSQQQIQVIQTLSPMQAIQHYLETGHWYDALTGFLQLANVSSPTSDSPSPDLQATWRSLLQQATLRLPHLHQVTFPQAQHPNPTVW